MLLLDDNSWTIYPKKIRDVFIQHFRSIYCEPDATSSVWPNGLEEYLHGVKLVIDEARIAKLEAPPQLHEIEKEIFELGPNKAPGPDGINARLIQSNWPTFRPYVEREVGNFFNTACMPTISKSNMNLIPKKDNPTRVSDFRSISICNVIYKIISKLLANRLKPLIPTLVQPNQVAFTPGCDIFDHVILIREVLYTFAQSFFRTPAFCLKSDLSKAFDRMS